MRRWFPILLEFVILAVVSVSTLRADYYVNCSTGSDSNPGTLVLPFRTLQKAKAKMESSSTKTTQVETCTYSIAGGAWTFNSSDNTETWRPLLGAVVVIDGGGTGHITLSSVNNFTFEGFTIQNMPGGSGRTGDILIDGGSNYTLRWNTFLNCKGFCIQAHALQSSLIDSNTFNGQSPGMNTSNNLPYKVISLTLGSSNDTVSHNLIENAEGAGIDFERGPTDPTQNNNVVDRNIVKNTNTNDCDMGALYVSDSDGKSSGLKITNNDVFGVGPTSVVTCSGPKDWHAIYLDNGVSGATVTGNICNRCGGGAVGGAGAVQYHGGKNNTVKNNIWDLSNFNYPGGTVRIGLYQNISPVVTNMAGNVFENNILYSATSFASQFWSEYAAPQTALTDNTNVYCSGDGSVIPPDCPGCSPPLTDTDPKHCCPGFVNPAGNVYTITNPSCTTQIGWTALPTGQGPLPNPFFK